MTERDVIVRCPGCGNGKVIALAVGQLLQCDICRTTFQAPIDTPSSGRAAGETDSFVVGPLPLSPASAGPEDQSAATGTPSDSDRDASASRAGITRTRSWRTDDLDVGTPGTQTPNERSTELASPSPSVVAGEGNAAPAAGAEDDEELVLLEPPRAMWGIVSVVAGGIIVATFILGGVLLFRRLTSVGPSPAGVVTPTSPSNSGSPADVHWTDASKASQRRNSIVLKIERATYGIVRVRDLQKQVISTQDDNLLAITISVRNLGKRPRDFRNWYGHSFDAGKGVDEVAELLDDQQRAYSLLKFDDVSQIEGQRLADQIGPNEVVQDTLVFLIPKDVDRAAIDYLRLTLPAAAVGMSDYFRFQIPSSMIEGFQQ